MAWKRLLAYSSLEHMGVIALGIGFGTPLALAGAALHVVGHAVAKTLGFLAATPLLADQATAHGHAPVGLGRSRPALAAAVGVALAALAGLPPSPLFLSQLLVITGGFTSGHPVAALVGAGLLSLGFLGLAHAAIEALAGRARRTSETEPVGLRGVRRLTVVATLGLVSLAAVGLALPGSDLAVALARGIG